MTGVQAAPGWRPLERPKSGAGVPAPFTRLARTQAFMVAGDTLVALALAGSLFFSISPDAARGKVALYLLLTMAPFAVIAPLVGPWIDRTQGGRRTMVILSAAARAVLCVLMIDDLESVLLFPEALAVLVLGKAYGVARASLVPGLVRDAGELVEANSKLLLIGGVVGFAAALPGLGLYQLGPGWVLGGAAACFTLAGLAATRIPATRVAATAADEVERAELRGGGILLAASAMAVLRGLVGFLSFHLAFWLRGDEAPTYWFGIALAASGVGSLVGAAVAPVLRRAVREERILLGCLALTAVGAVALLQVGERLSAAILAYLVGMAASAGKLCFDAIVQRDAPDANQGRSFARFETRFQVAWVVGEFLPVVVTVPLTAGYVGMAAVAAVATVLYATGRHLPVKRVQAAVKARVKPTS
jgi:hypothetical protein